MDTATRTSSSPSAYIPANATEEKALNLLGSGVQAEAVAAALGVSPARISQLLSREEFAEAVATIRYAQLQEHSTRDRKYDSLEDSLLQKLEKSMPLMVKPGEILKAITVVNGAKRRGSNSNAAAAPTSNIVNLVMPTQVIQQFTTNTKNQVVSAGEQSLVTIESGTLLKKTEEIENEICSESSEKT